MSDKDALEFIEKELQKRIESFDERRKNYRQGNLRLTVLTATLSAVTTFCIGVGQIYNSKPISIIALATSAGMTVFSTWDNFYSYRRRWVQSNDALMQLYELNSNIKYKKSLKNSILSTEEINEFYNRYESILKTANESWKDDRLTSLNKK